MLPPIQVDVARKSVNFGNLNQLIRRLHDVPRGRMLHKKWIVERLAPFRTKGDDIACLLPGGLPPIGFDKLGLEDSLGDNLFEYSAKAASSNVVSSFPGSGEIRRAGRGLREQARS